MSTAGLEGDDGERRAFVPAPRMRFAADRYGHHLIVYGGHGTGMWVTGLSSDVPDEHQVLKMNLITLKWSRVHITNRPHSYENLPGAALSSGVLTGGFTSSRFGVQLVPKLDFLCLSPPEATVEEDVTEQEDGEQGFNSSSEDDTDIIERRVFRAMDGSRMEARMPR